MKPLFIASLLLVASKGVADEDFDQRVMEAIMNNPEVVLMAIQKLEEERSSQEAIASAKLIDELSDQIFGADENIALVEFFDYRCSYCARSAAHMASLPPEAAARVRYVEFPILGEASTELAQLSLGVRNVAGHEAHRLFHDQVFAQGGRITAKAPALRLIAQLGFDVDAITEEAESEEVAAELLRNQRLANRLGISGTPTFIGRDRTYGGLLNPEQLVAILSPTEDITQ